MPPTPELRAQRRRVAELEDIVRTCKRQRGVSGLTAQQKKDRQRNLDNAEGLLMAAKSKLADMERRAKRERGQ